MRLGLILTSYACEDYIEKCLTNWLIYKNKNTENQILISAVSFPFLNFPSQNNAKNLEILLSLEKSGEINKVFYGENPIEETTARNHGLTYLLNQGIDSVLLIDADEVYEYSEIEKLLWYLKDKPPQNYRICYKNIIFDGTHFLDNFDPARIFYSKIGDWELYRMYDDNYVLYVNKKIGKMVKDIDLGFKHIPKSIVFPKHYTWLNNQRSINKIKYQNSRPGWNCSFIIKDKEKGIIDWNLKEGQIPPETFPL